MWKNGKPRELFNRVSEANSVFVERNNMYVVGMVYPVRKKRDFYMGGEILITSHFLWKNRSVKRIVSSMSTAYSVFVDKKSVYVTIGDVLASVEVNKDRIYLSDEWSGARSVFVKDNNVYVVGYIEYDRFSDFTHPIERATLWINYEPQTLSIEESVAYSVYVVK